MFNESRRQRKLISFRPIHRPKDLLEEGVLDTTRADSDVVKKIAETFCKYSPDAVSDFSNFTNKFAEHDDIIPTKIDDFLIDNIILYFYKVCHAQGTGLPPALLVACDNCAK